MTKKFNKEEFKRGVQESAKLLFRKSIDEVTKDQLYQAVAITVREQIIDDWIATHKAYEKQDVKRLDFVLLQHNSGINL